MQRAATLLKEKTIVIIPARRASTRLPGKALKDIAGVPMVVRVFEQAKKAEVGDVVVATDDGEIKSVVESYGGKAVMTASSHPSGTDRVYEAFNQLATPYTYIINVQGDLPLVAPEAIHTVTSLLTQDKADISTLAAVITDEEEKHSPHVVKAIISLDSTIKDCGRALYFTRAPAPYGEGPMYHHIGIYGYTRQALERFVAFPPSRLEQQEKLEQLRALENGMHIVVGITNEVPLGVDTAECLKKVQQILKK